jgi:hypothetical protein
VILGKPALAKREEIVMLGSPLEIPLAQRGTMVRTVNLLADHQDSVSRIQLSNGYRGGATGSSSTGQKVRNVLVVHKKTSVLTINTRPRASVFVGTIKAKTALSI